MKKKMRVLTLITALILVLTACGSSMSDANFGTSMDKAESMNGGGYDYGMSYDTEEWVTDEIWVEEEKGNASYGTGSSTDGSSGSGEILTGEKLVYTCDLTIQTLDYEECVETIKNNIATYNGIIERETESDDAYRWYYEDYVKKNGTRYLNLTIRIPSEKYYEFLDTLEGTGKIISKSSYVENISRQYYETGATWQISGLKYRAMKPNDPENIQLISSGHSGAYVLTDADTFANGTREVIVRDPETEEEKTATMRYAQLAMNSSLEMKGLKVKSAYTTDKEESSSNGAMTLTCEVDGITITVRTVVLKDADGKIITQDAYVGKTIDVKGVVDYYDGEYQIKVFTADQITIH